MMVWLHEAYIKQLSLPLMDPEHSCSITLEVKFLGVSVVSVVRGGLAIHV
jgi:hypothetical protein